MQLIGSTNRRGSRILCDSCSIRHSIERPATFLLYLNKPSAIIMYIFHASSTVFFFFFFFFKKILTLSTSRQPSFIIVAVSWMYLILFLLPAQRFVIGPGRVQVDVVAVVITGLPPSHRICFFLVRRWKFNFGTEINMDGEEEEKARAHTILSCTCPALNPVHRLLENAISVDCS